MVLLTRLARPAGMGVAGSVAVAAAASPAVQPLEQTAPPFCAARRCSLRLRGGWVRAGSWRWAATPWLSCTSVRATPQTTTPASASGRRGCWWSGATPTSAPRWPTSWREPRRSSRWAGEEGQPGSAWRSAHPPVPACMRWWSQTAPSEPGPRRRQCFLTTRSPATVWLPRFACAGPGAAWGGGAVCCQR